MKHVRGWMIAHVRHSDVTEKMAAATDIYMPADPSDPKRCVSLSVTMFLRIASERHFRMQVDLHLPDISKLEKKRS